MQPAHALLYGVLSAVLLAASACEDDRAPRPRGPAEPRFHSGRSGYAENVEPEARAAPERAILETIEVQERREEAAEEEEDERDLNAELRTAIGSPAGCGSFGDDNGRVTLRFSATITETGIVSRGQVSGNVPDATIECLTQRLGDVRLAGPIDDAPQTATATFELDLAGAAPERRTEVVPPPPPSLTNGQVAGTPIYGSNGAAIAGPSGEAIHGDNGQPIVEAPSAAIQGSQGVAIQGPGGQPIGQ